MAPATDYDEKFFAVRYQPRENGNYKCGICLVEFYYKHSDRTQTLLIHDPSKLFECDVCFISLTTKLRLIRHKALGYSIQFNTNETARNTLAEWPAPFKCPQNGGLSAGLTGKVEINRNRFMFLARVMLEVGMALGGIGSLARPTVSTEQACQAVAILHPE
ncbi:hypothetical protein quinque_005268 [Culex quinquefasciatus]